ncbi:MAG: hypothetical protein KL787_00210 [Taibaiella sp.]|nr:hypothetical protein [Taibaiella sp.]
MEYKNIAETIIGLKQSDLALRDKLIRNKQLWNGYHAEMEKLHNTNAKVLNTIIDDIGYPTIDKVGEEASESAWLVIQHAIGQPGFMKKCLKCLEKLAAENKVYAANLAYLSDRISIFEGKPQLYGTQFDWDENGDLSPDAYDDLEKVNERRKNIGFNTLEEQTEIMRSRARKENQLPPADFEIRKMQAKEWQKKVGWIK